jgi:hypothetical protein
MNRILALSILATTVACSGDSTAPSAVPHALQLSAAGPTSIQAGSSVRLAAVVLDEHGSPVSGQTITFSHSNPSLGLLTADGLFTSTGAIGSTTITATSGKLSNSISITVGHGAPATISKLAGDQQKGFVRASLPVNPSVQVLDQFGNAVPGAAVTFAVTGGSGRVGSPISSTDAKGNASTSWTLGSSVGNDQLTVTAGSTASTTFTASADSPYQIEVIYSPEVSVLERSVTDQAIERWRRIITTDLGAVQFGPSGGQCGTNTIPPNDVVRGLRVYVKDTIMGATSTVLAAAGFCFQNADTNLPIVAVFLWNEAQSAFIAGAGEVIATHELGHAIGFGTLWRQRSLLVGAGTYDPFFTGAQAKTSFASTFGVGFVGNAVPVENTGGRGTADSHWRETVFNRELMTGFISSGSNPLSAVTIAQFADLGYDVDMLQADIFVSSILAPGTVFPDASPRTFGDDVIHLPTRSIPPLIR